MLKGLLGWRVPARGGAFWPRHDKGKVVGAYFQVECRLTGRWATQYVGEPYTDETTGEYHKNGAVW